MIYWRFQFWADIVLVGAFVSIAASGIIPYSNIAPAAADIVSACRIWVAPILTLLGLVCATTAFLFSALERDEFSLLRKIDVEHQLWAIFSEMIFWLAVSAISTALISFVHAASFPNWLHGYALFLFFMISLCLIKFAWVMRHIVGVKMRRKNM